MMTWYDVKQINQTKSLKWGRNDAKNSETVKDQGTMNFYFQNLMKTSYFRICL